MGSWSVFVCVPVDVAVQSAVDLVHFAVDLPQHMGVSAVVTVVLPTHLFDQSDKNTAGSDNR